MAELREAFRRLRSAPLVTAVVVVSLALGIGANTAVFSLLDAALLRPLPIEEPHRLVTIASVDARRSTWLPQSVWLEIRNRDVVDDGFAWFWNRLDTSERGERQFVDAVVASGGMFESLGIRPTLGRLLNHADDQLEAAPDGLVAVISYRHWQRSFGGSSDVLSQSVVVDKRRHRIVGVMPREFVGLYIGLPLDIVIPLGPPSRAPGSPYVAIMGRLKGSQTAETASAVLRSQHAQIRDATNPYSVSPYRDDYLRDALAVRPAPSGVSFLERRYGQPLKILFAVVGLVLFIACGNVAMLLLARAIGRRRDLALRAALGATRRHLVWLVSVEGVLLGIAGVALGLVFADWGTRLVVASLSTQAYTVFLDLKLDWRVLGFTSAVGVATAFLFSVASALHAMRIDPIDGLRSAGTGTAGRFTFGSAIIVVQVALSLMLVAGAGLFLRTFWSLASIDVGFDRDRVLVVLLDTKQSHESPARIVETLETIPGVRRASASLAMPGGNSAWTPWVTLSDGTSLPQGPTGVYANRVTAGWFQTMGTPILAGRDFNARDRQGSSGVVIVSASFAERFLSGPPLGRTIRVRTRAEDSGEALEVVGVVQDAMYRFVRESPPPTIYTPLAQSPDPLPVSLNLSVRADGTADAILRAAVAERILRVEPNAALSFRTLSDQVNAQYAQERLVARLATAFGGLAVLLAALGLYGLTAYSVTRRRAEISIRVALGAAPARVVRLMLARVAVLIGAGALLGLAGSLWTARFIRPMLFNVDPGDTPTWVVSCALLIAVAVTAAWLPALRAARIDPAGVLKQS